MAILPEGPMSSELCLLSTTGAGTATASMTGAAAMGTTSGMTTGCATTMGSSLVWTSPPSAVAVMTLPSGTLMMISELGP